MREAIPFENKNKHKYGIAVSLNTQFSLCVANHVETSEGPSRASELR